MDSIGAEVGQKMRSAIKAKLMELGCYVDDELPDYIMVMVANKRTKAQMEDDLQLFLRSDTQIFVEWLQQVLKKLKEVQITNPEVCSSFKELKRKATMEIVEVAIKKEKKGCKIEKKNNSRIVTIESDVPGKSLTDEIPVQAKKLVEKLQQKAEANVLLNVVHEDTFDIPSLAEMNNLEEMKDESRKVMLKSDSDDDDDFINIRADAEDLLGNETASLAPINISSLSPAASAKSAKNSLTIDNTINRNLRILKLNQNKASPLSQKPPMSERLGVRVNTENIEENNQIRSRTPERKSKKTRISLTETLREEKELFGRIKNTIQSIIKKPEPNRTENNTTKHRNDSNSKNKVQKNRVSVHKRLGLPSSVVTLPKKKDVPKEDEEPEKQKSVMSVVQVKPRRTLSGKCQANKNLLLKAVAEAQKSVTQTAPVTKISNQNKNALFTKKYRQKHGVDNKKELLNNSPKKTKDIVDKKDSKITNLYNIRIEIKRRTKKSLDEVLQNEETTELSKNSTENKEDMIEDLEESDCIPNALDLNYDEELLEEEIDKNAEEKTTLNHQFIVTLDGLKDKNFIKKVEENKDILDLTLTDDVQLQKRAPSPIIFDKPEAAKKPENFVLPIPDKLSKMPLPVLNSKSKERCKYWPNCRLKDMCEFSHPNASCKMFPICKFGDRCLYIHPKCKFYSSCTRKDCPYSHGVVAKMASKIVARPPQQEICKYYPNCSNAHCLFYHPKPCRFGKYCMNKSECSFSHGTIPTKEKLTWHSNAR